MIQQWYTVSCDTSGCQAEHGEKGLTIRQTRDAATHAGWTRDHGNDLCPAHRLLIPDVCRETSITAGQVGKVPACSSVVEQSF